VEAAACRQRAACARVSPEGLRRGQRPLDLCCRIDQQAGRRAVRPQRAVRRGHLPKPAKAYLDDWAALENGWLRKYYVARKAEEYLASTGIADAAYFGAEAEFYMFDSVRFETTVNSAFHEIDSISGWWNTGADEEGGNKGYKVKYKGGYFPVPPTDHYADLRNTVVTNLIGSGFTIERAHHEVGTAGQAGINYKFNTLLHAADDLQLFKYIVKNTAHAGAGEPGVLAAQPQKPPYLAFAAMMMAGLDGIKNSYEPAAPIDKDPYELPPDETAEPP
jgi:glutamine synthetase